MDKKNVQNKDGLERMRYNEEITDLQYIYKHSQERIEEFKKYCQEHQIKEDENAAVAFLEDIVQEEIDAHTEYLD